jgi:hypothetical protein
MVGRTSFVAGLTGIALVVVACAPGEARVASVALRDPLTLIDEVYASGNSLRLYVVAADAYGCDASTGEVTPDVPDQEIGTLPDAVVDIALRRDELVNREVRVPPGTWTIFVRGRGNDPMSGRVNVPIARGCSTVTIGNGETVGVTIMLAPITVMGMCGDGILSPDEQCEPGPPECGPDCRTTVEPLNAMFSNFDQTRPRIGARPGRRVVAVWTSGDRGTIGLRLFDPQGRVLTGMGPLSFDTTVDDLAPLPNTQDLADAAVATDGRFAIALTDRAGDHDVRVSFWDENRNIQGGHQHVRTTRTGVQQRPALAFHSSNALLVVFEDASSPTGLSGRVFSAAGVPLGDEAFPVGTGQTGASAPSVAATAAGWVVAFAAGGDVFYQRFAADGAPLDVSAQRIAEPAGSREHPAVGALADGTFLVAWTETLAPGDAMGTGVRARIFAPDGTPRGMPFLVNTTLAGDQSRPSVAVGGTTFLVAFQSGPSIRARSFDSDGNPRLNRERPPSFADFEVAPSGATPAAAVIGSGSQLWFWIAFEGTGNGTDVFARRFPL